MELSENQLQELKTFILTHTKEIPSAELEQITFEQFINIYFNKRVSNITIF